MKSIKINSTALCLVLSLNLIADASADPLILSRPSGSKPPINETKAAQSMVADRADSQQDSAEGFMDGSHATLNLRNYYTRQSTFGTTNLSIQKPWGIESTDRRTTWIQAAMLDYRSGYTQGALGFGVDLSVWGATNLERGKGAVANGGDRTLVKNNGEAVSDWSRIAVSDVRLRLSNTELKAGRFTTDNPMLRSKDNRSLPSTFQGVNLISSESAYFTLHGGYVTHVIPRTGTDRERFVSTFGNRSFHGDSISYAGVNVKEWNGLAASLFASRFENVWDRCFLGVTYNLINSNGFAWKNKATLYRTRDQGARELGYIDNTIASIATTFSKDIHSFTMAYQQVFGDEYFDYQYETNANLNNIALYSDFNGPNEKSLMVKYDTNFIGYGVPGLTTSVWYAKGWDIDGTHYDGDKNGAHTGYNVRGLDGVMHWEVGFSAAYTVLSGSLKDSVVRTTLYHHRGEPGQIDGSFNEIRLVTNIPLELF
ncbi:OprD family outer membrane porin [Pseudomonas laurentiana]